MASGPCQGDILHEHVEQIEGCAMQPVPRGIHQNKEQDSCYLLVICRSKQGACENSNIDWPIAVIPQ